jgi:hypothetical protein
MSDELNGIGNTINVRGYFERILAERDRTDTEREHRLDERFQAQEQAIRKAEGALSAVLSGFPQEYAKVIALEEVRKAIEEIKGDHVQRREVEELKKFQAKMLGGMAIVVLVLPIVTGVIVYILTRHAVPLTPPPPGG